MNKLQTILDHLNKIAGVSSNNEKKQLISELGPLGQKVLFYGLSPYLMFGIKNFNLAVEPFEHNSFEAPEQLFITLDALARREVTGNKAKEECEFVCQKYQIPTELLHRILNKDLRAGIGATLINKVFPKLIPEFNVALANKYEPAEGQTRLVSIKYDGLRCVAFNDGTGVVLKTRGGLEITSSPSVNEAIDKWPFSFGKVLDGEIMLEDAHFQESSGELRKKSKKAKGKVLFQVFDWVPLSDFLNERSTMPQLERYEILDENKPAEDSVVKIVKHRLMISDDEIQMEFRRVRAEGHEGLILKDPYATYQYQRSNAWVKMKDVLDADCKVLGIEMGKGKYEGKVGALVVDFEGKPNSVGSGISDYDRDLWARNPDLILGKTVEIQYHERTKDGNMRHSRLHKVRFDK